VYICVQCGVYNVCAMYTYMCECECEHLCLPPLSLSHSSPHMLSLAIHSQKYVASLHPEGEFDDMAFDDTKPGEVTEHEQALFTEWDWPKPSINLHIPSKHTPFFEVRFPSIAVVPRELPQLLLVSSGALTTAATACWLRCISLPEFLNPCVCVCIPCIRMYVCICVYIFVCMCVCVRMFVCACARCVHA
jgi:hypothetical protein